MRVLTGIRTLERLLWTTFAACAVTFGVLAVEGYTSHVAAQALLTNGPLASAAGVALAQQHVIGRLEIPAIRLSVPVVDDFDSDSLIRGVGHIPGTAVPGGLGNLGLAGHRDTYFRPLRSARPGMKIDIFAPQGLFQYQIDSTEIVTPDQVRVLDIGSHPEMTLITCYPFNFIGAAPQRFIVHARLLSVDAIPLPTLQTPRSMLP